MKSDSISIVSDAGGREFVVMAKSEFERLVTINEELTTFLTRVKKQIGTAEGFMLAKSHSYDPNQPNLALQFEYHKNIEAAYKILYPDFISCDLDTFSGILKPGYFKGKVMLSPATAIYEIKHLLESCTLRLNFRGKIWKTSALCFEHPNLSVITNKTFIDAKSNFFPERKKKIDLAAKVLLTL